MEDSDYSEIIRDYEDVMEEILKVYDAIVFDWRS